MPDRKPRRTTQRQNGKRYGEWRLEAAAALLKRGVDPSKVTMSQMDWKRMFIANKTPDQAAQAAETHYWNIRLTGKRRR